MTITGLINSITDLILVSIPILVGLALLFFFIGLAQWMLNISNAEKRKEYIQRMIWGIISLFVIVSIWGIINILIATFGINTSADLNNPTPPRSSGSSFPTPFDNNFWGGDRFNPGSYFDYGEVPR